MQFPAEWAAGTGVIGLFVAVTYLTVRLIRLIGLQVDRVKADEEDVRAERELCERRLNQMINAMHAAKVPIPEEVFGHE